VKVYF